MSDNERKILRGAEHKAMPDKSTESVLIETHVEKRRLERIATRVLQGICVNGTDDSHYTYFAKTAVRQAKALIKELDEL